MKSLTIRKEDRRIVMAMLLAVAGLSALLVWAVASRAQTPIPHNQPEAYGELGKSLDCLACHQAGVNGAPQLAGDHIGRDNEECLVCHQFTGALPSLIPHPEEGQEDCIGCHEAGIGTAGALAGDHVYYANEDCLDCHRVSPSVPTPTPAMPTPTPEPGSAQPIIPPSDCSSCHRTVAVDVLHSDIAGQPSGDAGEGQIAYAEHCATCHGENGEQAVVTEDGEEVIINSVEALSERDDAAIMVQIATGVPGFMPAFGPTSEEQLPWSEIRSITAFVRAWAPHAIPAPVGGDVANGAALYAEHCAACHGDEGQGGPPARDPINTREYLVSVTDDALRQVILEGTAGMPGLAYRLSDEQVLDIVSFMRSWEPK